MKNLIKFMQIILLGGIILVGISPSEALDDKPGKPVHRSLEKNRRSEVSEKDEKLKTASQSLFGYNNNGFQNGFNNGFNGNGFSNGVNGFSSGVNGFNGGVNGFGTGVNGGVYPQGNYASSGSYTGGTFNQNGLSNYPNGFNGNNVNGFGFQGQGVYPGVQGAYPNQGFQQGGFNTLGGFGNGRYPPFNGFGTPFHSQGPIGIGGGNFQTAGYPNNANGLYTGGQITDRRANQYIGDGITVGNKIAVGGDGRSASGASSSSRTGRTNQPGFVAGGQGFGLNYADQAYNILPGGVFNANNGLGYPGGAYRQNPNIYNMQFDYNRFPNSGTNRYYPGGSTNPQGSFQQRIHRFVGPDSDRRN